VYSFYNATFEHSICVSKPTQSLGFNIIYYVAVFNYFIQLLICFNSPNNCLYLGIWNLLCSDIISVGIKCVWIVVGNWRLKNKRTTWYHLLFYFTS
jgi:hypothetical protein